MSNHNQIINNLDIDIYADGADIKNIELLNELDYIKGFTTNPTLMRQSGIENYKNFAIEFLSIVKKKPISFEVFADDLDEIYNQALKISDWGDNIFIKIPITNTQAKPCIEIIKKLNLKGVKCNVTAVFTYEQINDLFQDLDINTDLIISVFAGRIADTGIDPIPKIKNIASIIEDYKKIKLLWASPREILNIFHAIESKCDIITVPHPLLNKMNSLGKNLDQFSLETVQMFFKDAEASKYNI
tara:strand:+ start:2659 stop:3387 length:729 start_codon:yes stop_codon:yes gene_type:complete